MISALIVTMHLGCGSTLSAKLSKFRAENRSNLTRLSIGMSKAEVLDVMGVGKVEHVSRNLRDGADLWNPVRSTSTNPHRIESYPLDSSVVEILYYHTDVKDLDGAITDDELTPIVLVDDKLVGWGWDYWEDTAAKYEIRIR